MKMSICAILVFFSLLAQLIHATGNFSPFKLEAKYFDNASIKDKYKFEHEGNQYRISKTASARGLSLYVKEKGKKTGSWKKHGVFYIYSGGKLSQKLIYDKGKKEGEQISYYTKNGTIKTSTLFKNGLENGQWEKKFDTGSTEYQGTYKNGLKVGIEKVFWSSTGKLRYQKPYEKAGAGKMHGTRLQYDEDGVLVARSRFERGVRVGKTEWLHKK